MSVQTECLSRTPLTASHVEAIYHLLDGEADAHAKVIRSLCLSHERLRAELLGAETLLKEVNCPHCGDHCDLAERAK